MINKGLSAVVSFSIVTSMLLGCSSNNSGNDSKTIVVPKKEMVNTSEASNVKANASQQKDLVVQTLQTEVLNLSQHPSYNIIMIPDGNLQTSIDKLLEGGGKLIYDPNNRIGSEIPFYIAELTPEQINDTDFVRGLNLKAAQLDRPNSMVAPVTQNEGKYDPVFSKNIPSHAVGIDSLGDKTKLGKGITVAVVDTGIDASHPAFGNRVVYWYDATEETKTLMTEASRSVEGGVKASINGQDLNIQLPEGTPEGKTYVAKLDEGAFLGQLESQKKYKKKFHDLNYNNRKDQFLVVAIETDNGVALYFDSNGDLKIEGASEVELKMNYNDTDATNRNLGLASFPSRNNVIKYPLLFEIEGEKRSISLGKVNGMHGTHVAGIIAADDPATNMLGAAPKAQLMSLRVCSDISCTDSAIVKGLYKAFYNGKHIPDVVNISLGSHEQYKKDAYSYLLNDLSAKFGTVFFISASNSGPGFRSLNHFGNSGAVVMVGAHVSKETLVDQYNLPEDKATQQENLLFFSSVGPSYTGEMKPNIIAPGAAVSAVPFAEDYMTQANGTSMSSPLAAGAFASLLATLRAEEPSLFTAVDELRAKNLAQTTSASGTLLPYVYAMRDSLQNGAEAQPNLTAAQQGYGLMKVGPAKELLKQYLAEIKGENRDYFEIVINNNQKSYSRKTSVDAVAQFNLSIGLDGERTKDSLAKIIAQGVDVELAKVEILATDGAVAQAINATDYFHVLQPGSEDSLGTATHVAFNNRRTTGFVSVRHPDAYEPGNTYIAHYVVKQGSVVISNILDVVHSPLALTQTNVSVPNIDPQLSVINSGLAKANVKIGTNQFHRYPLLVTSEMTQLNLRSALAKTDTGRIYIQLYNPDGEETLFLVAQNSPTDAYTQAVGSISTLKGGKVQAGVWELTVSTSSSNWLDDTTYDLLVDGQTFGVNLSQLTVPQDAVTPVIVQTKGATLNQILFTGLEQFDSYTVQVKSGHTSFHPIKLPKDYKGKVDVELAPTGSSFWGDISPYLYKKTADGKFEAISNGVRSLTNGSYLVTNLPDETIYISLDTITNYVDSQLPAGVSVSVQVRVVYDAQIQVDLEATIVNQHLAQAAVANIKVGKVDKLPNGSGIRAVIHFISGDIDVTQTIDGKEFLSLGSNSIVVSKPFYIVP